MNVWKTYLFHIEILKTMSKYTKNEIKQLVNECISVLKEKGGVVQENKIVTFGNRTYPNFGWCVFLAGSGGCGKGYALNTQIPISGKTINVDNWKEFYAKLQGVKYHPSDPEQVAWAHQGVAQKKWKQKYTANMLNPDYHTEKQRLPNIIFDMTAKNPYYDVLDIAEEAQNVGYKTMLVWVIATRSEALIRNLARDRHIPDYVLHDAYNSLMDNMPRFLQGSYATECLDDAWLIFSSAPDMSKGDLEGDEKKTAAVQLQRGSKGFIIDKNTMQRLVQYLGEKETNIDNPQTFLSSKEVIDKYGIPNDKGGYDIDRTKIDPKKGLYR